MTLSFRQLFALLIVLFTVLLCANSLFAWTAPAGSAPGSNSLPPINVGTSNQVKNGGLSVNALAVFGTVFVQNALGIGTSSPATALDVVGTLRIGDGGESCQSVSAGVFRYSTTTRAIQFCDGNSWHTL